MNELFRLNIPKLGFGLMRLPAESDGKISIAETSEMVDMFLDAGMKYFDTAYVYEGSEEAAKKALVERHAREKYFLATKLNVRAAKNADEAKKEFEISLERTGAKYFDFYLLHALSGDIAAKYEEYGIWDFVKEEKEKGRIRHFGFSFHDRPEVLKDILEKHPEAEFVQLQLNYADWESPSVCSRENYELCLKYEKPIVVMEPVRGGALADPMPQVKEVLDSVRKDASYASLAIRFIASKPGILTVLSGMSSAEQMRDNLSYMKDFKALDAEEDAALKKAQDIIKNLDQIPCTSCNYCTGGCPMNINIPGVFNAMNRYKIFNSMENAKRGYDFYTSAGRGKASECISCGQCEAQCPQHIEIIRELKDIAALLESA